MVVVVLVLLTFATLILFDWYRHYRRGAAAEALASAAPRSREPTPSLEDQEDLFFHPGHAWVRLASDGQVTVGASELASNFAGQPKELILPTEGERLRQGDAAWTFVSQRGRRLQQVMPVDGTVVAVNRQLQGDPQLAQRSPYAKGWLLRVRPRRLASSLRNLMHGLSAKMWLDASRSAITSRIGADLGVLALDGGEWVPGFGDLLEDQDWHALESELFPAQGGDESVS